MRMLICFFITVFSASAIAQTIPNAPHIIVKGFAEARVLPDTFQADFILKKTSFDLEEATTDVEGNTAMIIDIAKRLGAKPSDLQAMNIQISPSNEYNEVKRKSEFAGNQVSRKLNVRFKDKKTFQKFLSSIPQSQLIQLNSVRALLSTYKALEFELFKKASSDAKNQAKFMADTFDLDLLGIYTITSNDPAIVGRTLDNVVVTGNRISPPEPPTPPASISHHLDTGSVLEEGELIFKKDVYILYLVQDRNAKPHNSPTAK